MVLLLTIRGTSIMLDTIFAWLYKRKALQALFIAIITSLPFFYCVDSSTNWNEVLVTHWYYNNRLDWVGGVGFLIVYGVLGNVAYVMGESLASKTEPPTKYFLGLIGVVAFLSFAFSEYKSTRMTANYLYSVFIISSAFLIANWRVNNENIDAVLQKTSSLIGKSFGWFFFILWLSLMGYLVYDWIN
jgi:hypothetical protein